MALNPKLALKSVASIKTFGAVYKVDTNHAWLLPIDENNRRCQAAGYSGLKDYLIKKGLKITKWKETGLIKELVTPSGERMTFDKQFPFPTLPNAKSALKENVLLRTSSCSIKKSDAVLSPKRIRSLSPNMKHTPVKYVESKEQKIDTNINTPQTSINVCYTMRRSKTLSVLKYDKENNTERNASPSKPRNALPLAPGKSLMCLPKVSLTQLSEEKLSHSARTCATDKQNILRGSLSYRKIDSKKNSSATKESPKLEMRVTHKQVNNVHSKNSRDNNASKPPNNKAHKRSETHYRSGNKCMKNKVVDVPTSESLEPNNDSSTTSTCISMFTARSSIDSFKDRKESVIQIDITSPDTETNYKKSSENIATTLLYAAEGCDIENEDMQSNSFSKICIDETNEEEEENSKKNYVKSEVTHTAKTAVQAPEYSEQVWISKPRSTEVSSDEQLSSERASIPHNSTKNNNKGNNNEKGCSDSVISANKCVKGDENDLIKKSENSKEADAEFGEVEIACPTSVDITQKLHISNAVSEQSFPETTALTLNCSDRNYSSLIDVRYTLKDLKCTLKNMRRNLEHCSKASQKTGVTVVFSDVAVSKQCGTEAQNKTSKTSEDNDVIVPVTDASTLTDSSSDDCKETQNDGAFENANYNTAVTKEIDRNFSHDDETFRPVLLLHRNSSKAVEKANSFHEVPTFRNNFADKVFLEIEASNSYSSVVIRKLIESPLYTQDMYKSLSSAISPNICYQLPHPIAMKRMLLQKQHEINKTTEEHCGRSTLQMKNYKDAQTQTQNFYETINNSEFKISGACVHDACEIIDEFGCKNSNDDDAVFVHEDSPESQSLQVDVNDKDEDSDEFSVYEDALELF